MGRDLRYLAFGLLVLSSYWLVVSRGWVLWSGDGGPSSPAAHTAGRRAQPTFWSTGYQGGK